MQDSFLCSESLIEFDSEPRVSVVVYALNEAQHVPGVFGRMPSGLHEVVLVDGGSTDGTVDIAQAAWPELVVVRYDADSGADPMVAGFAACTGDIIVTLDAAGSYDPAAIPTFTQALLNGAHFAKGTRVARGSHAGLAGPRYGRKNTSTASNLRPTTRFCDLCSGYNAFWAACLHDLGFPDGARAALADDRTDIDAAMTVTIAQAGLRVTEVPYVEPDRNYGAPWVRGDGTGPIETQPRDEDRCLSSTPSANAVPAGAREPSIGDCGADPVDGSEAQPRVSVVIPTLNEARNLPHVARRLSGVDEIVVVDGGSLDDTIAVARKLWPDATIVRQTRKGKGNALACGFAAVTGDIIVMLDADGSADPGEIPSYVAALTAGADFAKGSRCCPGGGSSDITAIRRLGNKALNGIVNVLCGTQYTDLCYGYNAFWTRCLSVIALEPGQPGPGMLWGDGFEVETLINVRIARAGLVIVEVPSFENNRIHGASNLHAVSDGLRVLRAIARERRHMVSHRHPPVIDPTVSRSEAVPKRDVLAEDGGSAIRGELA